MLSDLTDISHLTSHRPVLTTTVFPLKSPPCEEGNNPVACNVEGKKSTLQDRKSKYIFSKDEQLLLKTVNEINISFSLDRKKKGCFSSQLPAVALRVKQPNAFINIPVVF